jgi:hypothetical protein
MLSIIMKANKHETPEENKIPINSCLKDIHNATQTKQINIKNRVSNPTFILRVCSLQMKIKELKIINFTIIIKKLNELQSYEIISQNY